MTNLVRTVIETNNQIISALGAMGLRIRNKKDGEKLLFIEKQSQLLSVYISLENISAHSCTLVAKIHLLNRNTGRTILEKKHVFTPTDVATVEEFSQKYRSKIIYEVAKLAE